MSSDKDNKGGEGKSSLHGYLLIVVGALWVLTLFQGEEGWTRDAFHFVLAALLVGLGIYNTMRVK